MPPEHTESEIPRKGKGHRVEQLADNFASALLMPERTLAPRWQARGKDLHAWLNAAASELLAERLSAVINAKAADDELLDLVNCEMQALDSFASAAGRMGCPTQSDSSARAT